MKIVKKHWLKLISLLLIIVISVFVLNVALKKVKQHQVKLKNQKDIEIYTVWHIETFEGGSKSRIEYLKKIARNIEKKYENVLFLIKQISVNDLKNELELSCPDIFSFGFGVGTYILPFLQNVDFTCNVRDELVSSGSFNKKLYAIPYIVSGYCMFTHNAENDIFFCGKNNYIKPENIYSNLNLTTTLKENQYEAYKNFINNKKSKLLGTCRDLYRISNLNNIGRCNAIISPIDTYSDLIQYMALSKTDKITLTFLKQCVSQENQQTLTDYSLFSSLHNKLYFDGIYNDMENAILNCKIPNVFNG